MFRKQQTELEQLFREALRQYVGDTRYSFWFTSDTRFMFDGDVLTVETETFFKLEWLRDGGYIETFKKLGHNLFGREIEVRLVLKEPTSPRPKSVDRPRNASQVERAVQDLLDEEAREKEAAVQNGSSREYEPLDMSEQDAGAFDAATFAPSQAPYNQTLDLPFEPQDAAAQGYPEPRDDAYAPLPSAPAEPVKRGRGRPRKNPDANAAPKFDAYAQNDYATPSYETPEPQAQQPYYGSTDPYAPQEFDAPNPPKRKRGRPRKTPPASDATNLPSNGAQYAQPQPAQRSLFQQSPASSPPPSFRDAFQNERRASDQVLRPQAFPSNGVGAELSKAELDAYAAGSFDRGAVYDSPRYDASPDAFERERPTRQPSRGRGRPRKDANAPTRRFEDEEETVSRDSRGFNVVTRQKDPTRIKSEDRRTPFLSLGKFVVKHTNATAYQIVQVAVTQPFVINPIYISGPTSVGKTHLLEGLCDAYARKRDAKPPLYMTGLQFTEAFVHSLRGGAPFRERFNNISLFALDDVHFLEGKSSTQVELLNLYDYLRLRRVQFVVTANKPIDELDLRSELTTRLESGVACNIEPPERELLAEVMHNMALDRRLIISDDVCRFVVSRYASNARQVSGALNKLFAEHLATGAPIDIALAQRALADLTPVNYRNIKLDDVERVVQEVFGLESNALKSASRAKKCADPRAIAMWLARKHTRAALAEIGYFFGGRKHSAVLSAQKKVDEWLQAHEQIDGAEGAFTVNDVVELVERKLSYPKA